MGGALPDASLRRPTQKRAPTSGATSVSFLPASATVIARTPFVLHRSWPRFPLPSPPHPNPNYHLPGVLGARPAAERVWQSSTSPARRRGRAFRHGCMNANPIRGNPPPDPPSVLHAITNLCCVSSKKHRSALGHVQEVPQYLTGETSSISILENGWV
ncbi:hypothetical protein M433DRAFT_10302 [Acidomyces richmondensis BFW]|nr:MAG: hypothetical protein FE78DRAFT_33492 [Acidomyces sp. 'richmondensis']KYG39663.1 hypothetical protein M433DRAFT_10302 [Acidomyces richmondensis BFW]